MNVTHRGHMKTWAKEWFVSPNMHILMQAEHEYAIR